ncbi:MAG: PAS domain-containing protein [Parvibaculum sp.]|nr:PAS domain-containing protein [Parvibaculum sp.]
MPYTEIDLDNLPVRHPVRMFNGYWASRRHGAAAPLRQHIVPGEIAGLLRWLLVLETVQIGHELQFRYRLAGTGCTELFGIDYTGKILGDNLTPEGAEIRRREFRRVMESVQPIYSVTNLPVKAREFIVVHRGVFPVSTTGAEVDQIFVVIAPVSETCLVRPAFEMASVA